MNPSDFISVPTAAPSDRTAARRWLPRFVAGAAVAVSMLAAPAAADAAQPCDGQVCLYDSGGNFVGSYHDPTTSWQYFNRTRSASAFNGFGNNAAYFTYKSGKTSCIQPKRSANLVFNSDDPVTGIMIVSNGNCYPDGKIQT
jgi:opacity protein-like surface antigen